MIVVSPFSNNLPDGKPSPKNWPLENWIELVRLIKEEYPWCHLMQVGTSKESQIKGTDIFFQDRPLEVIAKLVEGSKTFISVDNFLPHLGNTINKNGIVIWGPSDSRIFGYDNNINLHGDRSLMRKNHFWLWTQCEEIPNEAFPTVEDVMNKLRKIL